jgi:hypothetical protein
MVPLSCTTWINNWAFMTLHWPVFCGRFSQGKWHEFGEWLPSGEGNSQKGIEMRIISHHEWVPQSWWKELSNTQNQLQCKPSCLLALYNKFWGEVYQDFHCPLVSFPQKAYEREVNGTNSAAGLRVATNTHYLPLLLILDFSYLQLGHLLV